jgi:hypothetical protein
MAKITHSVTLGKYYDETHISSTWKVTSDVNGENIVFLLEDSAENILNIGLDLVIPENVTYYVFVKRHFSNNTTSDWIGPNEINHVEDNEIYISELVRVEIPSLSVENLDNDEENIVIKGRGISGDNLEGLDSVLLFITDARDNFIHIGKYDSNTIELSKIDLNLNNYSEINIKVIYRDLTGVESPISILNAKIEEFSFDITSSLKNVNPYQDLKITLNQNDPTVSITEVRLTTVDGKTMSILAKDEVITGNDFNTMTIPGKYILEDTLMFLDINTDKINSDGTQHSKKFLLSISDDKEFTDTFNPSIAMDTEYTSISVLDYSDRFVSKEMANGDIFIPSNTGEIGIFNYSNNTLHKTGTVSGITLLNPRDVNIVFTRNNKIIIDSFNISNKPTFFIYTYNTYYKTATLDRVVERSDEINNTVFNNNMYVLDNDNLVYSPNRGLGSVIRKLNISTGEISTFLSDNRIETNNTMFSKGSTLNLLIKNSSNLLRFNKEDDMTDNRLEEYSTMPIYFRDKDLFSFERSDGTPVILSIENSPKFTEYKLEEEVFTDEENCTLKTNNLSLIKLRDNTIVLLDSSLNINNACKIT